MIVVSCSCNGRVGCFPLFVILVSCGCIGRAGCFPLFVILVSCRCNGRYGMLTCICDTGVFLVVMGEWVLSFICDTNVL